MSTAKSGQPVLTDAQASAVIAGNFNRQFAEKFPETGGLTAPELSRLTSEVENVILRFRRVCRFHGLRLQSPRLVVHAGHWRPGLAGAKWRVLIDAPVDSQGNSLGGLKGATVIGELEQITKKGLVQVPGDVGIGDFAG